MHEDKALSSLEAFGLSEHRSSIATHVMVAQALIAAEHRIEALRVEIAIVDLVPPRSECPHRGLVQSGDEACFDRMGVDDENLHGSGATAWNRRIVAA